MIQLNEVSKTYALSHGSSVSAVSDVSLEIGPGEFVIIVGRSGSGKTTLLNLAAGLTRPTHGQVRMDGVNLWELSDMQQSELRAQRIGFIFQFPSLLPALTVLDNVILPTIFAGRRGHPAAHTGRREPPGGADARRKAMALLQSVGLEEKLHAYPRQLSAGQQQRVVVARALMNHPQTLLADEPTSNLDEKTELEIMELFRDLHARLNLTVVMVTHTRQLTAYGTRTIEMAAGKVVTN
jgi:ABC-type lipoprotein export system ATPase subunit